MLATTGARDLLRAAIAERDEAAAAEIAATKALVRGKQMLDEAEQTLSALASVESDINAHHAGAIESWAVNGGERPSGILPPHLEAKKTFKTEVETKVTAARSAHELLKSKLQAAAERLQGRNAAVQRAAGAVLSAEAGPLIDQLLAARRTLWALEDKLKSLSAVRYAEWDGRSMLIKMPPDTFAAINETAPPAIAGSVPKPYAIAFDRWNAYLQALTQDPSASLD
jgi:hypothetical protein